HQDFSTHRAEPAVMTSPPPTGTATPQMTTRSASTAQNIPTHHPSTSTPTANGQPPARNHNGQVLMSRIERMEKEQRDQKNMLTKILGAVTGQMADV
ncbi:MAG: hypothetical protein Q9211_005879, partial [Gyalolechia sp. 1 TL-2023]